MKETILFKVPGHASSQPVVILGRMTAGSQCSTSFCSVLSRTLCSVWNWMKCNCAPRSVFNALFSVKASYAVGAIVITLMVIHNIVMPSADAAAHAVGIDFLCASPWAIVWAFRFSRMLEKEGGEV